MTSFFDQLLSFLNEFRRIKRGVLGLAILLFILFMGILAPYVAPFPPYALHPELNSPPTGHHILGTDHIGRDLLSQIIWGARASLFYGGAVGTLSLLLGILIGLIPGWYGGKIDHLLSRVFEVFLVIPTLLLAIVLVTIFGTSSLIIVFVLAITLWPSNAKITRAQVLSLKNKGFVEAAISSGVGTRRILFLHILPNGISPLLANSFLQMARAILSEAALAFFGLSDPRFLSWGRILLIGKETPQSWWMLIFPGMMITLLVVGLNFIGDALNFILNPRMRQR